MRIKIDDVQQSAQYSVCTVCCLGRLVRITSQDPKMKPLASHFTVRKTDTHAQRETETETASVM